MVQIHEGMINAQGKSFAIIVSRFNNFITERLLEGALDAIHRHGGNLELVHVYKVPGCFEIPVMVAKLAASKKFDSLICLGTLIRGSTPHFDYICAECTKGIAQVALQYQIPIGYGVITADTLEQAIDRAGSKAGNKGAESAIAAIEMANVFDRLSS
jgi:6,7-dimethyl-8-ribityllumazine synthase